MNATHAEHRIATELVRVSAAILERLRRIGPGDIACGHCGHVAPASAFTRPAFKAGGKHNLYRYCPECQSSIDWPEGRYADYKTAQAFLRRFERQEVA